MLIVLSPAKTLDYESPCAVASTALPAFKAEANTLAKVLKQMNPSQLSELMDISPALAELNYGRWQQWRASFEKVALRPAIMAFQGDVYVGMEAHSFSAENMEYAQKHLRILSGLYGLLRPLDAMQPYRLEMGTDLPIGELKNLYSFWGNKITDALNKELKSQKNPVLVNLASNEYFKSVKAKQVKGRVITPTFKEHKNGRPQVISFMAKKARGMMAAFLLKNEIEEPERIKEFCEGGYLFSPGLSQGDEWVFAR